jgi:hypothetical protein
MVQHPCLLGIPDLDVWLTCSQSGEQAAADMTYLLKHISALGLRLNIQKIHLVPTQTVTFVGIWIDLSLMRAHLTKKRVQKIVAHLNPFVQKVTVLQCQRLLGLLFAASLLTQFGLLHLRPMQRWFNAQGLNPKDNSYDCV